MMKTLKLYFTSDIHGYSFPTDYISRGALALGLFQCAAAYEKDGNTLVIDGGDYLQGSALNQYCWRVLGGFDMLADMLNACGYDYVTLGNHDFNFGQAALWGYLDRLDATCLCENVQDDKGQVRFPHMIHVLENGLRVGLVGIVTEFVNVWEKPGHLRGLQIASPLEAARAALGQLEGQVDLTIGIYHGGFERDLETGALLSDSGENVACQICEELDFDVLLTGHQHMGLAGRDYCGTYIIQPPEQGRGYAFLEITQHADGIAVHSEIRTPQEPSKPHPALAQFAETEARMQAWLDEPVGELPEPLTVGDRVEMALHGAPLADFFNMIQLRYSGAQISAASLANDARGLPQSIRRRDLFAAYPYANTFVVLEISGAALKAAVERSAEYLEYDEAGNLRVSTRFLKPKVEHYNHDFYAGITTEINYRNPVGDRVQSMRYDGEEITADAVFTICVNDYRASGAGGYPMYPSCPVRGELRTEMTDMLLEYFDGGVG